MSIFDGFTAAERAILEARARRLANIRREETPDARVTALLVSVGQEVCALPIEAIGNVHERVPITPVPCAPPFLAGVATIRGRIILALDLAALLGVPPGEANEGGSLVVLADADLRTGLQVGAVLGVESLAASTISAVPSNVALRRADYIQGILPNGTALLNLNAILGDLEWMATDNPA